MPEVAEVKIIGENIAHFLRGRKLLLLELLKEEFRKRTRNIENLQLPKTVVEVNTKGKFCYIRFHDGSALGVGFGMDGNVRPEPTAENLAHIAFDILNGAYRDLYGNNLRLERVRIYETPNNWADCVRG